MSNDGFLALPSHQQRQSQQQQQQQQHTQIPSQAPEQNSPSSEQHQQLPEFPQGEDVQARNVTLTSRIGSTGSQLISPINEVRKRTGRRVLHRPRPLDLNHAGLHGKKTSLSNHTHASTLSDSVLQAQTLTSAVPPSHSGTGFGQSNAPTMDSKPRGSQPPLLQIKTNLTPSGRRSSSAPSPNILNGSSSINATNPTSNDNLANDSSKKIPSKWQLGLERLLKKIQRRKRAPSNLRWYADHSTESYLSGATTETTKVNTDTLEIDNEAENLYFGHDKPPKWVIDVLNQDQELFYSDDTVELVISLRDFLISATENGWDITELKEEVSVA
ncbi:hypothetical protein BG004_002770 [Podila humilis]|nr:hypothetical protein BG004_002770 [Podila humilis]